MMLTLLLPFARKTMPSDGRRESQIILLVRFKSYTPDPVCCCFSSHQLQEEGRGEKLVG